MKLAVDYHDFHQNMLAMAISETIIGCFIESSLFSRKLNGHRYFGAYEVCFELGAALGYRFQDAPDILFSLFAIPGGVQTSLDFIKRTVIEEFGDQIAGAKSLGDLGPQREEQRVLLELRQTGRILENRNPDAIRQALTKMNVLDSAAPTLALAVTLGAGVGICYPDCYKRMLTPEMSLKDVVRDAEEIVMEWATPYEAVDVIRFLSIPFPWRGELADK